MIARLFSFIRLLFRWTNKQINEQAEQAEEISEYKRWKERREPIETPYEPLWRPKYERARKNSTAYKKSLKSQNTSSQKYHYKKTR